MFLLIHSIFLGCRITNLKSDLVVGIGLSIISQFFLISYRKRQWGSREGIGDLGLELGAGGGGGGCNLPEE